MQIDCPVSGGVGGAEKGTLAVMVSGPSDDVELLGRRSKCSARCSSSAKSPASAQTMKLANNFLSATGMVASSEAMVMGVKAGLDPAVMIDVINAGSGMNTASRDKFPRSVLPGTFDYGFGTALMVKDVRLCLDEMKSLGLSMEVAEAVGRLWETVIRDDGREAPTSPPRSSRSRRRRVWWSAARRAAVTPRSRRRVRGANAGRIDTTEPSVRRLASC